MERQVIHGSLEPSIGGSVENSLLFFSVVVVNDPMDDPMRGRTAHWLGWWLLRTHDAQEVQQRQGWEEMGEEGNKSQSEVEEPESGWEKEKIW